MDQLQLEARAQGYQFIDRLVEEWNSAVNRFDGQGEILFGCFDDGALAAVGGLNRDPYACDKGVCRIRRVYVRKDWRKRGIGRALVEALIEKASRNFGTVRLRAETPEAFRLYESAGFVPIMSTDATHTLKLDINDDVLPWNP